MIRRLVGAAYLVGGGGVPGVVMYLIPLSYREPSAITASTVIP